MILQKDLKLFRLINVIPQGFIKPRYQYQLLHKSDVVSHCLSNYEYANGKVTVTGDKFEIELLSSASDITDLESDNVFIIDVEIIK